MTLFVERAKYTDAVLEKLAVSLENHLGADAERVLREDTCIYVVGSGGRGEMSSESDVDLFVARVARDPSDVDAFLVRQAIARAFYDARRKDPSQGGAFLQMHTAETLCERMGEPEDDATNTLTARMLLLLESRPLLGEGAYRRLLNEVIAAYWKNQKVHAADYQPFVIVNDMVRYWRTLLLNYEAKNMAKGLRPGLSRDADQRIRSYKLRFSRCLTCFSALAMLIATTDKGAVTQEHVLDIVQTRPIDRLHAVARLAPQSQKMVVDLLDRYASFLEHTAAPKKDLLASFDEDAFRATRSKEGREFGNAMFELILVLGATGRARELFRHLVV